MQKQHLDSVRGSVQVEVTSCYYGHVYMSVSIPPRWGEFNSVCIETSQNVYMDRRVESCTGC